MLSLIRKIIEGVITLSITLLVSCHIEDPLAFETREVDFINKTGDLINGKILDLDVLGGKTIAVYDTLLMVITNNPAALLQVYDTRTLKPLAMLCQQGNAKNEFSDKYIFKSDQTFLRNGDVIIVLRGEGGYVLKEINVSASLREGHTVVEGINNSIPYGCQNLVGLDNAINCLFTFNNHNYSIDRGVYNVPSFSIRDDKNTKEIEVYRRLIDFENKRYSEFWYSGTICKHPSKNIVVQCMSTIDYIHFFDLDNNKYFSIHQIGTPTFENIKVPYILKDGTAIYDCMHFNESIGSDNFFLVLYMNGEYKKKNLRQGNRDATELLAFDWEGNYLGGVKLDVHVHDLAYNSKSGLLYGFRINDEKIVTYDLSDFIKSIGK